MEQETIMFYHPVEGKRSKLTNGDFRFGNVKDTANTEMKEIGIQQKWFDNVS